MNSLDAFDDNPDDALEESNWVDNIGIGTHIVRKQPVDMVATIVDIDDGGYPGQQTLYYVTYPEYSAGWVSAQSIQEQFVPAL